MSRNALDVLESYDWPGNVRQLANAMEYAYITSKSNIIDVTALPIDIVAGDLILAEQDKVFMSFEQLKKKMVIQALQKTMAKKWRSETVKNRP